MRVPTGIHGFDELIEGGFLENRVYLVSGPPGSGKTTFATQFLSTGAKKGEVGLYVSLTENPLNIIEDMSRYNFGVKDLAKSNLIYFMDMGPISYFEKEKTYTSKDNEESFIPTASHVIRRIEKIVKKTGIKRLVIDSVSTIKYASGDVKEEKKEMTRFVRSLKELGCTTLLLSEMTDPDSYTIEHFLSHGVIFLHNFLEMGEMIRALQVIKMRGTMHDCSLRRLGFSKDGLNVSEDIITFYKS